MDALLAAWRLCQKAPVVYRWERLGKILLIPFAAEWNRLCTLWIREIIRACDLHRGIETESESVLTREWLLSGYDRSRVLERGIVMGHESSPPTVRPDDMAADEMVVV
jgi:hypothetical protein